MNSSPLEAKNPGVLSFSNNLSVVPKWSGPVIPITSWRAWPSLPHCRYTEMCHPRDTPNTLYTQDTCSSCSACDAHCCHCCLLTKSCLTICDPTDRSPPGSSVHGILQARTLEWVAISSSRESSQPRD